MTTRVKRELGFTSLCCLVLALIWVSSHMGPVDKSVRASAASTMQQGRQPHVHHAAPSKVQPLVDGSKNPEAISDQAAIKVLLLSLDIASDASPSQLAHFRMKMSRMRLAEADTQVLIKELGEMHGRVSVQRRRIQDARKAAQEQHNADTRAALVERDRELESITQDSYGKLLLYCSREGAAKLKEHLAYVKTRIRVIPPPPM